ncbi:MAG: hypothetical protein ACRCZP_13045 [Phycicoccus sp.]
MEQQTTTVAEEALVEVSDPLAALCAADPAVRARVGAACATAAQVASAPAESPTDGLPGRPGVAGPPGTPGVPGAGGADSTVPGPEGPAGSAGGDGQPGTAGQDGEAGQDGTAGADGAPGAPGPAGTPGRPPAGFTFIDPDGRQQTCARDAGSPDDAATYTCTTGTLADPGEPQALRFTSWPAP